MTDTQPSPSKPKCFVIMPIADIHGYEAGHFSRVYEYLLKPAIIQAGFLPIRADDAVKTDYIVVSIIQQIVESEMVICDFSARNPNVMYELGLRHAFNKPVALLKDRRTEKVFDIQGLRYSEYDESLRIDSVQKDISRISAAIIETAKSSSETVNSVVQLAGIKAAEVPAGQTVSADTSLLLQAIGSIEKRLTNIENEKQAERFFHIVDNTVTFQDGATADIGETIFNDKLDAVGELVDIRPADDIILIKSKNGKILQYHAHSIRAKGFSSIPF